MSIHRATLTNELLQVLAGIDCWAITVDGIENLSRLLIEASQIPLLRRGNMRAIIAGKKFGGDCGRFNEEFLALAAQCASIRSDRGADLCATAFFHLRFENIHPLTNCNGRLGRILLAEQIRRAFGKECKSTLEAISLCEPAYRAVFASRSSERQFELMIKLVANLAGAQASCDTKVPFAIAPAFPELNTQIIKVDEKTKSRFQSTKFGNFKKRSLAEAIEKPQKWLALKSSCH